MTSESGAGSSKRHNPVDSICRKIKTIQMRDKECNPILQIPKFQSRNFESPQNNAKRNLEMALKNRTVKSSDKDSMGFSTPGSDSLYSQEAKTFSPGFVTAADFRSPLGNATYSIIVSAKERTGTPWLAHRTHTCSTPLVNTGGVNYGFQRPSATNLELMSHIAEDENCKETPSFYLAGAKSESVSLHSPVVKRLSLGEGGGLRRTGEMKMEMTDVSLICEEDLLDCIFQACDIERRGKVAVSKIVDYLRYTTSRGSEDTGLDELCSMLDPDKRDVSMDLDTYHAIMKEWIDDCRNKGVDTTTKEATINTEDSIFKLRESFLAAKRRSGGMNITSGSLEAFGGDVSKGDLETSDLITCVADLQFGYQKLEVQQAKLKLSLEGAEESNNRLIEENEMLRSQMKNAQQYIAKAKSLKEELEEMKANLNSLEEKNAQVVFQNKQLEKDNVSLVHKISSLQEENIRNAVDLDRLQMKMAELSGSAAELQLQLNDYENIVAKKDASFHKKELYIEEMKSSFTEYVSVIEALRTEKAKLENNMQQMQQELISHGIDSPLAHSFNQSITDERKSLHSEMQLAEQSPQDVGEIKHVDKPVSSLGETFDREVLLLLQGPGQEKVATEFKTIIQNLQEEASTVANLLITSLRRVVEPEMNSRDMYERAFEVITQELKAKKIVWIQKLKILEKHKGSLDQEFAKVAGNLRRLRTEHLHLRKELSSRVHDIETLKQLHEEELETAVTLGEQLHKATKQYEDSNRLVIERDVSLHSALKEVESARCKLEEAVSSQKALQAVNSTLSCTCRTLEKKTKEQQASLDALREKMLQEQVCALLCQNCANGKPDDYSSLSTQNVAKSEPTKGDRSGCLCRRFGIHDGHWIGPQRTNPRCLDTPLLDALTLEVLQLYPRLCTNRNTCSATETLSWFGKPELSLKKASTQDHILCGLNKGELFSVGIQTDVGLPVATTMESQISEENVDELLLEVAKTHYSENQASIEAQGIAPSVSGETVISAEHASESLEMEIKSDGSNLSHESGGAGKIADIFSSVKKEADGADASETGLHDKPDDLDTISAKLESPPRGILKLDLGTSVMEAVQETPTEESTETSTEGITSTLVTDCKTVTFGKNNNDSTNEREMEAEFLRLSLGFKCDLFTLDKRLRLEERSRDLAEENLKKEISNCLKLLETLIPVCEEDNQSHEIVKKLEKSLQFLSQHTDRVASRAELLGAIHQESRVSKAVDVMIQHVENLKRMYAREHAELEELKLVLLQNEKSFGSLGDTDESQNKKRPGSVNSKPSSVRRVSIASFPRSSGNPVTGVPFLQELSRAEKNDQFQRRSTNWRLVGSKPNGNRPSLKRLISTCAWTDAEEHSMKGNEQEQRPTDEEEKAKMSHEEENKPNAKTHSVFSSWASHFRTSCSKGNIILWISLVIVVFLTALMSFLTGLYFQRPVDAAPLGTGDSWTSLQQLLWPFTGLQHNGQPPV